MATGFNPLYLRRHKIKTFYNNSLNTLKQKVYHTCLQLINDKITTLQKTLSDLRSGTENDTKSSAGDKHETARAMMQIEHENISKQLNEMLIQKNVIESINPEIHTERITKGSLVKTDHGYFFLSIALGKILVGEIPVIALSAQSPLGNKLAGLSLNDTATMNDVSYIIEEIN